MKPADYVALGWALVPIPKGTKGPNTKGWNLAENCRISLGWAGNVGLAHAYSGTAAIDLDRLDDAAVYLKTHGIDVNALLNAHDAVRIDSGRPDRAKLLYKCPVVLRSLHLANRALELRCATADGLTAQDVLPPSIHPETGKPYQWVGDYTRLPDIPPELLALWQRLAIAKPTAATPTGDRPTLEQLRALLAKHSPNAPYEAEEGDSFLFTGMAISDATDNSEEGFALWGEFLRPGIYYEAKKHALPAHWRSFKAGGGITWQWLKKGMALDASDFSALPPVDDIDLGDDDEELNNNEPAKEAANLTTAAAVSDTPVQLRRKRNGRIEANILSIYSAIQDPANIGLHVAYDEFRAEIMRVRTGGEFDSMEPFGDENYTDIRMALERFGFESTGVDNVRQAVYKLAKRNTFDSARDWLDAQVSDGVSRVPTFLRDYFGAEDSEYTRQASLYLWTALAGRVRHPACQADMALILYGRQGCRKSTSVAAMAPRPEQFVRLSLDQDDDDLARMMAGTLIGELPELRGLASKDLEAIKDFITGKQDKWVPKYKEFAHSYPRRTILIGTTNKREFLADETGERRFIPVHVSGGQPEAIRRDLSLLWAEARDLHDIMGVAWQRVEALAAEVTREYKISDGWEDSIALWLASGVDPDNLRGQAFTTAAVATGALGIDIKHVNRGIEMRISKILTGLGYSKKRTRIDTSFGRLWSL